MTLAELTTQIQSLQTQYDRESGALESLQAALAKARARQGELATLLIQYDLERLLLGKVSDMARTRVKTHVEQTVTAALQSIIDDRPRWFEVRLKDLGGQPAVDWIVKSKKGDDEIVTDPEDGRGGGVLDACSIALRMCVLELSEPRIEGPLVLDEPGRNVSTEFVTNLAGFLQEYAAKTGRQVIMITHEDPVKDIADVAYRFKLNAEEISEVVRL